MFSRFSRWIEQQVGRPATFAASIAVVILWVVCGPVFNWSDTWQLVINTGTTIVTFLMVFLIQSTQSRDTMALHLKLDELIKVNREASNSLIGLEDAPQREFERAKIEVRRTNDQ